ncbi:cellulose binding domain-containing protein [Actinomadura litoris]|uniref:cellulose binding domain-containing protein n=1 Tax=Actinomadura litoris TaxID=2678616 RepID=UPI001FA803CC|nr:cellulose binding domain-containing protein [Actinomadura litoris]
MSGEEPGYVPPDHTSTAEFRAPGKPAGEPAPAPDPGVTGPDVTAADAPADPAPAWATDTPPETPDDPPPADPLVTAVDPEDAPSAPAGPEEPAAPGAPMPPPSPVPMAEEGPWTAQFGAEQEQAAPPSPLPSTAPSPGGPPPEETAPASALPITPVTPSSGASGARGSRRGPLVLGLVAAVLVAVAVGAAALLLSGGSDGTDAASAKPAATEPSGAAPGGAPSGEPTEPTPSTQPTQPTPSGEPTASPPEQQPGGAAPADPASPAGPLVSGDGITYQLVQRDEGYHEGRLVITNRTGRPMTAWRLTFSVPGADVRNIWGGRLVRGGAEVELASLDGAAPIPPGAAWEVRFGARGAATTPEDCEINGRPCGF